VGQLYHRVNISFNFILFSVLLVVCVFTPISLAFVGVFDDSTPMWNFVMDMIINVSFFIDLILTFFSAYEDQKLNIIDNR
jgi:hypothetical protein